MKTIVVVPCYNESKRLRQDDFLHYVEQNDDVAFLFANDGSRDNTLEVLQELTAKHTPLEEIEPMVKWADKGYDAVMGLRLMRLGAKVKRKTMRHYLGRCFATVASMMLKLPVYDTQCGSKLFRREVVEAIFQEQFITRWLFDVELLARYKQRYGVEQAIQKIYEYPLFQWEDVDGSQLKSRDFFKAPLELMKIRKRYKNKN